MTETLDKRHYAGFAVELLFDKDAGKVFLDCSTALHSERVEIPPERAWEAFNHPCLFCETPALFFKAPPEGTEEEEPFGEGELIPF